jgi:hypothetical protein
MVILPVRQRGLQQGDFAKAARICQAAFNGRTCRYG